MTTRARAVDVMNRTQPARQTLAAEVEEVRREARRRFGSFVLEHLNPGSHFRNRERQPYDPRVFIQAGEVGLIRFSLPVEIGGEGRDKLAWGVVVEEVARLSLDPAFAVLLDITVEICELILSSGRPELIERYVPDLMAGRRFGVQGAYENRDPFDYQTTARLEGDEWVLNGAKRFLAAASFADLFVLFVRDEKSNDMLAFLVDKNDPGVARVAMDTMGMSTMGLGQVVLHDVHLPQWRLVWRADALSELNTYARIRRSMSACGAIGALESIVDSCVQTLSTRRRSGRRVLDYPNVERTVGEMRALLQQARGSVYRALDGTRVADRDAHFDEYATVGKHHAAECAMRVGHLVMGLMGGEGYMSAFPWERYMRDVLGLISGQGSQEMLLIQLGQRAIVTIEGKRTREEAAERNIAKLTDAWWVLHAMESANLTSLAQTSFATAVREVVATAGLEALTPDECRRLTALLDRAHALVEAVCACRVPAEFPEGPGSGFNARLLAVAQSAWSHVACVVANETGLLFRLLGAPERATGELPDAFTAGLLDVLVRASVARADASGRYQVDEGLERVLIGGPRTSAFSARLRRAMVNAAKLRSHGKATSPREVSLGADRGGESAPLVEALVASLLGALEGLPQALDCPGATIACLAEDGGQTAVELARYVPFVPVLAIESRPVEVRATYGSVERRASLVASDELGLAWVPASGRPTAEVKEAIMTAAQALLPGGWIVVPCPLPPKRPLGLATARLDLAMAGGALPATDELEGCLRSAGLGHVRTAWEDAALGVRLLAARRP